MKPAIKILCFYVVFVMSFSGMNSKSEVFFSPDDCPTKRLIELIDATKKRIYAAVYMLTDKEIAQALIAAKKRGVKVKIITDKASVESDFGKARLLRDAGIETFVFVSDEKYKKNSPLMHNKFAILDDKLWTGSFNWTKSANLQNQENVILTTNKKVCKRFEEHFEILKQRCKLYKSTNEKPMRNIRFEDQIFWKRLRDFFKVPTFAQHN